MKRSPLMLGLALLIVALAALGTALGLGLGQQVRWLAPAEPKALPSRGKPPSLPQLSGQRLALVWQQSMFSPTRSGDRQQGAAARSLAGIRLTGVVIDGDGQWALLRLPNQHSVKLAVGKALANGWTLQSVSPNAARLTYQGRTEQLELPVLRLPPPSKKPALTLPEISTP